jgi:hypothetical protein
MITTRRSRPTNRRQFKLWLIAELRNQGSEIADTATYAQVAAILRQVGLLPVCHEAQITEHTEVEHHPDARWTDGEIERLAMAGRMAGNYWP